MRHLLILSILINSAATYAQQRQTITSARGSDSTVYNYIEHMPAPGYDIMKYIANNLRYPESALKKRTQGRVIVQFVVNEDGTFSNMKVLRGIGDGCDEEAIRVLSAMPAWKPGKHNGKLVKALYAQPVSFKLE